MRRLVSEGWIHSEAELLTEALRRYLESHQAELMDRYVREDVRWGLDGTE